MGDMGAVGLRAIDATATRVGGLDDPASRDRAQRELWTRTAIVAGRLNRAQAELVTIAVELLDGGHWGDGGFRSAEHYLVVRAGLSPSHARDVVAVARRRGDLGEASAALDQGALSLDQVAVVARGVPEGYTRSMTELARHATVPQLRRAVARHAFATPVADPPSDETGAPTAGPTEESASERRACARPQLAMYYDTDGRFQLRYSAPATVGALVEQALKEAKDALFLGRSESQQAGGEVPSFGEAVEELAHRSLDGVASTSRASHYRVYLHLSTDGAWMSGGHAIPRRLFQRFLTDGVLQPVWESDGRPVSVGRDLRILPLRSRRLVEDRDRGCRFPGCTATRFVEIHHLQAWAGGGGTDWDNLVSLCPFHHDAIGRGDYRLIGDPSRPDGLEAVNRYGVRVGPPYEADLAPPRGGDPPEREEPPGLAYPAPTGEPARWADIEIPPDVHLPRAG